MTCAGLAHAAGRADPAAAAAYATAAARLVGEPSAAELAGACSGLNGDGSPLQLCVSARAGRTVVRLLGDPAFAPAPAVVRWRRARRALVRMLDAAAHPEVAASAHRALAACGPHDDAAAARWTKGVLWLATALDGPGMTLWIDLAPWDRPWDAARRAVRALLAAPDAALATIDAIAPVARPTSLGLEGSDGDDLRVKLYWKLARPTALARGGTAGHADPLFGDFLERVVGTRPLPLASLHLSAGFRVRDGSPTDAKVDVCACVACRATPVAEWPALLADVGQLSGVDTTSLGAALAATDVEPALLGLGIAATGARRVNLYVKAAPCS